MLTPSGCPVLSGAHMTLFAKVRELLHAANADDIVLSAEASFQRRTAKHWRRWALQRSSPWRNDDVTSFPGYARTWGPGARLMRAELVEACRPRQRAPAVRQAQAVLT